jgi:hypothetical protein
MILPSYRFIVGPYNKQEALREVLEKASVRWLPSYLQSFGEAGETQSWEVLASELRERGVPCRGTALDVVTQVAASGTEHAFYVRGFGALRLELQFPVIEGWLRVSSCLENDPRTRGRLVLFLFLGEEQARMGFENFEQQSHGKIWKL